MSNAPPRAPGELAEIEALPKSDFRQGRRVPRNVYHGDEPLFMAATDELAAELVLILNAGATALRGGFAEAEQMRERAAIRAEIPDTLNTGNLVHDVRTLRMAHDSMHRHAYRWGKAAILLLPFVDMAAGEGLEWSEQDGISPRMDAADLCVAFAEAMGCELGDAGYTAMLKEGQDAIRALSSPTKIEGADDNA